MAQPGPSAQATPPPGPGMDDAAPRRPAMRGRDWLVLGTLVISVSVLSTWWRDRQAAAQGPALAALAQPGDIHMISSVTCVFCAQAREWLNTYQVAHSECFIERDEACLQQYRAYMTPGTPLLLVRGQPQRGFSPQAVRERLELVAAATGR